MELALGADEVMESLELSSIADRTWNIQACSAMTQVGLNEGMKWLIETINTKAAAKATQPTAAAATNEAAAA